MLRFLCFVLLCAVFASIMAQLHFLSALDEPEPRHKGSRARAVRRAARHAWAGYARFAPGRDELLPLSRGGADSLCGVAATAVDALSTLWIMGLRAEYSAARSLVLRHTFNFSGCSVFETNIRVVGGLLSASELSGGDPELLAVARLVADAILPSFETPSGIPCGKVSAACTDALLADAGTFSLEFETLSRITGNSTYASTAARAVRAVVDAQPGSCSSLSRLLSNKVSVGDGRATGPCRVSLGGEADSFYEYLLKHSIMTGSTWSMQQWRRMMNSAKQELMQCSSAGVAFVGISEHGQFVPQLDHLSCFVPGMLVLGDANKYGRLAESLLEGCLALYSNIRRLGVETAFLALAQDPKRCLREKGAPVRMSSQDIFLSSDVNHQRPEIFESIFYLWRHTKQERYRTLAWNLFQAIVSHQRVESGGFAECTNANVSGNITLVDMQQSFLISETFKYLYLTFSPDSTLDLKQWVFNTEGHPLPVFS